MDEIYKEQITSAKAVINENLSEFKKSLLSGDFKTAKEALSKALKAEQAILLLHLEEGVHSILHTEIQESVAMLQQMENTHLVSPSTNVEDIAGSRKLD